MPWVNLDLPGGKSDPFFEVRKGRSEAEKMSALFSTPVGELMDGDKTTLSRNYMGTKGPKSLLARSNIVSKCLDPEWFEVEIDW